MLLVAFVPRTPALHRPLQTRGDQRRRRGGARQDVVEAFRAGFARANQVAQRARHAAGRVGRGSAPRCGVGKRVERPGEGVQAAQHLRGRRQVTGVAQVDEPGNARRRRVRRRETLARLGEFFAEPRNRSRLGRPRRNPLGGLEPSRRRFGRRRERVRSHRRAEARRRRRRRARRLRRLRLGSKGGVSLAVRLARDSGGGRSARRGRRGGVRRRVGVRDARRRAEGHHARQRFRIRPARRLRGGKRTARGRRPRGGGRARVRLRLRRVRRRAGRRERHAPRRIVRGGGRGRRAGRRARPRGTRAHGGGRRALERSDVRGAHVRRGDGRGRPADGARGGPEETLGGGSRGFLRGVRLRGRREQVPPALLACESESVATRREEFGRQREGRSGRLERRRGYGKATHRARTSVSSRRAACPEWA